jgi:hypothetical protein
LRRVIVDSLDDTQRGHKLPKQVVNDASWRLGFAIRDLPVGSGRDRWLNPLCMCFASSLRWRAQLMFS